MKISVILPAYNAEKYIKEALDSILSQTFADFELIVLNDCSQDSTEELILSYEDPRVVYVKNEENLGVAGTLNKGLALAKGEYIARMDADDISLPERFQRQVAYMDEHPEVAVLGTAVERFGAVHDRLGYSTEDGKLKVDLLFGSCFTHPSVMLRREVIRQLGGYDPAFEGMEDYELWCRVAENHALATLPQVLLRYRIHPHQVTQRSGGGKLKKGFRLLRKRMMEHLDMPTEGHGFAGFCSLGDGVPEHLADCAGFLRELAQRNRERKFYDQEYLEVSARSVILRQMGCLKWTDALKIAPRCGYSRPRYICLWLRKKLAGAVRK